MPPTIAQAMKDFVKSAGDRLSSEEIKRFLNSTYPNQWQPSAIQAHLYACVVNNPGAYIHHRYTEKFMFKHPDGSFEFYDETLHGPNTWVPASAVEQEGDVNEYVETSISLEKDIEDSLAQGIATIETGLRPVGRQVEIEVGRIDLLAEDSNGNRVVIEVKVGEAKDSSIGQLARYLGWYSRQNARPCRGILIASAFPQGVRYAAAAIPSLTLLKYRVNFTFERVEI